MAHSSIRLKVRRRKVAHLAAYSRQFTVKNCTIRKADDTIIAKQGSWEIPEGGYKQYKPLQKKHMEWIYNKEKHITEKIMIPSTFTPFVKKFDEYQKKLWKNSGKAAKMEAYVQDKLKKWEKRYPKPCPTDDLFKDEYIPIWEHEKELALERIRDFVVSMFDKLPLTGRFKQSESKFEEKQIAEIKDINGDGHQVNELDENSKLVKKAQKITNKVHAKHANLVCTNLKDHKRTKGRIILPKAA